jgi:hypothetical protein
MTGIMKYCIAVVGNTGLVARLIHCTMKSYCQEEESALIGILSRSKNAVHSEPYMLFSEPKRQ